MYDKEEIYKNKIEPLMNQIIKICKENDMQILCSFMLKEIGRIACTTYIPSKEYNNTALMRAVNEIVIPKNIIDGGYEN